ncbi:MAG TPA: ABC transporter permease [Ramlibacter sp.]|nr:ABC transporter permease [Ramlibacter sp.]
MGALQTSPGDRAAAPAPLMVRVRDLLRAEWRHVPKGYVTFSALALLWLLASGTGAVSENVLPSPWSVAAAFADLMRKGILPEYVAASLAHLFVAVLVGIVVAVPLGIAIGINRYAAKFFYPLLNFFQSLSGIAWIPLYLLWFGFNEKTIIAAVNYTVIFPVAFNTLVGVRTVRPIYSQAVLTLGGNRLHILRDVILPGALGNIVTGMRLGVAYGWRALIGAEIIIGANGLGYMIFSAQTFNLTANIVLGMLIIGVLWLFMDKFILRPIEQMTTERWGGSR